MFEFFKRRKLVKQIEAALDDDKLTADEAEALFSSANSLRIPKTDTHHLISTKLREIAHRKIQGILDRVYATDRFSYEDEAEMRRIAEDLKLTFDTDLSPLAAQRFLWEIENGHSPRLNPMPADISLKQGEQCFHICGATWSQPKTVRQNRGYVGGSMRFRVAKGVSVSVGRAIPVASSSDQIVPISDGHLYVTNYRILFIGSKRSNETASDIVARIEQFPDAVQVLKTRGTPDYYTVSRIDAQMVPAVLMTLVRA